MVKQKSILLIETLKVKTALNSYKKHFTAKPLNVRSLDKQDSVEIKEWSTKKLTSKQVQHKGIESSFHIGVRQGGVLSPLLFDVYVNELSELLNKSGIGGNLGGTLINHMLYADDICIVSLSSSGLQHLLNICSDYCERHNLTFNAKKSICMYFSTSINKHCGLPVIYLSNCECQFVNEVKYLGAMIHSSMKTTIDVTRQTKKFYMQANLLLRNIRHCSDDVKCSLF